MAGRKLCGTGHTFPIDDITAVLVHVPPDATQQVEFSAVADVDFSKRKCGGFSVH